MAHGLTAKGYGYLAAATAFLYFLSTAHHGPWSYKYDMPPKAVEKFKDIPEIAALFAPEAHPALRKN